MSESGWAELLAAVPGEKEASGFRRLLRTARELEAAVGPPEGLSPLSLALFGEGTLDPLVPALALTLRAGGIEPDLHLGTYGAFLPEFLDPESPVSKLSPRIALVLPASASVPVWPEPGADRDRAEELAAQVSRHFLDPCIRLNERCGTEVILGTLPAPALRPLGHLGAKSPEDRVNFTRRVNLHLGDLAPPTVHLLDQAALAERVGLDRWFDPRLWHLGKFPFSPEFAPLLAHEVTAIVRGILGRARKVLVTDLDNTLWGGVIGDDGLDGIELGEGSPVGEAHKALQLYLRSLKDRGVLLAVCSKNEDETARLPFRKHPETVLTESDFVAFRANWDPKSENLKALARELDLGLESFVFLDDNPAEREQVRQALPQVAVPDLSPDPADFPRILDRGGYFELPALTEEDRRRSELYRGRSAARELEAAEGDLSEFLASLEMVATIRPFEAISLPRITQLINKTNQFNLTTRRVTGTEVEEMAADPSWFTRTVRLSDRFGDHGLISVLAGRIQGDVLDLDLWLMSCRVLKRDVECLLMNHVIRWARENGIETIRGTFIPSGRNELVRDHYPRLGFALRSGGEDADRYELRVAEYRELQHRIDLSEESLV